MKGLIPSSGFLWAAPCLALILSTWLWLQKRTGESKPWNLDQNELLLVGGTLAAGFSLLLFLGYVAVGAP